MTDIKLSDTEIQRKAEELLKDEVKMRKLAQQAVVEVIERLRRRKKREKKIDNAIEDILPRRYSGYARDRMRNKIRENLRKNHKI